MWKLHDNNKLNESTKENRDDVTRLYDEIGGFCIVNSNNSLDKKFVDTYATNEQAKRDAEITRLLRYYINTYDKKSKSNRMYKGVIFWTSIIILLSFSLVFLYLLYNYPNMADTNTVNNMVALITVCVTYLTLVISILKIITKYVFPQNEEEYITHIVKSIQDNDLKNKKANIKSSKRNT